MTAPAREKPTRFVFESFPKQTTFVQAALSRQFRYLFYGGAIRGGKTWLGLSLLLLFCRMWPRSRWAIVRQDLPTLRRNVVPTFEKLRPTNFCGRLHHDTWTYTCTNGSEIILFPESADRDPELERFKGLEVNGFLLEEAPELRERTFWKCIERAGAWVVPGLALGEQPPPVVLGTCNPAPGWVKKLLYDPYAVGTIRPPYYFLQARATDNPYISKEQQESWKAMPLGDYERFVLGSWENMAGLALGELDHRRHVVTPFPIPTYWRWYAAFDWGFNHPWMFGLFTVDEDGNKYLVETLRGRRDRDPELITKVLEGLAQQGLGPGALDTIYAGHDCWSEHEARGDSQVTTAERFADAGLTLTRANIARIAGLKSMREALAWTPVEEGGEERVPQLRLFRTANNLRTFDCLAEMKQDPDRPEDALKVDANSETGEGGDDPYDMVRYAVASRTTPAATAYATSTGGAWSKEVLAFEAERKAKGLPPVPPKGGDQPKSGPRKKGDLAARAGF